MLNPYKEDKDLDIKDFLNSVQAAGIEFSTHAHDGFINLTPQEVIEGLEDREAMLARHFGVDEESWDSWLRNGVPAGITLRRFLEVGAKVISPAQISIPATLRWEVWERDNFTCRGCGSRHFLTIDHVIPRCKGGPDTKENLQTLCGSCNSRKGNGVSVT